MNSQSALERLRRYFLSSVLECWKSSTYLTRLLTQFRFVCRIKNIETTKARTSDCDDFSTTVIWFSLSVKLICQDWYIYVYVCVQFLTSNIFMSFVQPLSILCRSFHDIDVYTMGFHRGDSLGHPNIFRAVKQCLPGPVSMRSSRSFVVRCCSP